MVWSIKILIPKTANHYAALPLWKSLRPTSSSSSLITLLFLLQLLWWVAALTRLLRLDPTRIRLFELMAEICIVVIFQRKIQNFQPINYYFILFINFSLFLFIYPTIYLFIFIYKCKYTLKNHYFSYFEVLKAKFSSFEIKRHSAHLRYLGDGFFACSAFRNLSALSCSPNCRIFEKHYFFLFSLKLIWL
jgi:hypothetical protein